MLGLSLLIIFLYLCPPVTHFSECMSPVSPFIVYKASAGSGKTYTLVLEYLRLALSKDFPYRHILAVTFTNKATGEMKMRILASLYTLVYQPEKESIQGYRNDLTAYLQITPEELEQRAQELLQELLHHYDHFFVETMDSFFQRLLRNLTGELGINSFYNITLDADELLEKAVDRTLDDAQENRTLLEWISQYLNGLLEENKNRDFTRPLFAFSRNLLKESYQSIEDKIQGSLSKEKINDYKQTLSRKAESIRKNIRAFSQRYEKIEQQEGFGYDDFAYGKLGVLGFLKHKLNNTDPSELLQEIGTRVENALESSDKWFPAATVKTSPYYTVVERQLRPLLQEIMEYLKQHVPELNALELKQQNLDNLGLIRYISAAMDDIKKEEYQFLLSDTVHLLDKMVGDDDISFVYEKIGTQFRHIMIDEFQDTSKLSWNNFRKLIKENVDSGRTNVVVGDVKQSIYRWRNGDWSILKNIGKGLETGDSYTVIPDIRDLETNFRTGENIVTFNNRLFTEGLDMIDKKILADLQSNVKNMNYGTILSEVYADVEQKPRRKDGFVRLFFYEKNKKKPNTLSIPSHAEIVLGDMLSQIQYLKEQGEAAENIAILIRQNKELDILTHYFTEYRPAEALTEIDRSYYTLVSDDAFILGNSTALQTIMAALQYLSDPEDSLAKSSLILFYHSLSLNTDQDGMEKLYPDIARQVRKTSSMEHNLLPKAFTDQMDSLRFLPLMDAIENITRIFHLETLTAQSGYLYSFYDHVLDFTKNHAASIDALLKYWKEELCKKKAPQNEQVKGIRVHTIHKSKGMEFKHVFIPFCDWNFQDARHQEILWIENNEENADFPILPIPCNSKLKDSLFAASYYEEMFQQTIDNLNLLYVALTRPKNSLFVYGGLSEKAKSSTICNTVGEWIYQVVKNYPDIEKQRQGTEENIDLFQWGAFSVKPKTDPMPINENPFELSPDNRDYAFVVEDRKVVFSQTAEAHDFLSSLQQPASPNLQAQSERHKGIVFHELLSRIRYRHEEEKALAEVVSEGLIESRDVAFCRKVLQQMLSIPESEEWFSKKHTILIETDFVTKLNGQVRIRRPDRVIDMGNRCVVLDYKFQEISRMQTKYEKQIRDYMKILTDMGYQKVEGVLWYVDFLQDTLEQELVYF